MSRSEIERRLVARLYSDSVEERVEQAARNLEGMRERGEIVAWRINDFGPWSLDVSVTTLPPVKFMLHQIAVGTDV